VSKVTSKEIKRKLEENKISGVGNRSKLIKKYIELKKKGK
jgi:hypothetical protein